MELSSRKTINCVKIITGAKFDPGLISCVERMEKDVYSFEYDFASSNASFNFNFYQDGACVLKLTEANAYLTVSLFLPEGEENKYAVDGCVEFNVLLSQDEKIALLSKLLIET